MKISNRLLLVLLLVSACSAAADTFQTYNLAWSGASFKDSAQATGQITIDLTTLPNPGGPVYDMYNDTASLTITVVDAPVGDGTWNKGDLTISQFDSYTNWDTGGGVLNLNAELIGQPTMYGQTWGTPNGHSGDFNLFFGRGGPSGTNFFTLTTDEGYGDQMLLTEFAPDGDTPEPGTFILLSSGVLGIAMRLRR
jgi:hypothetical protein